MPYYLDNAFLLDNPWITVVGCGGTGGFVAEGLCRLFQGREATIVLVDHDRVEPHNLLRQNFYHEDVGRFKSQALADRLAKAFRRPVGYSVYAFREEDSGSDGGRYPGLPSYGNSLLIGCADNAAARRAMAESLPGDPRRWLIDAGNDTNWGQVLIGNVAGRDFGDEQAFVDQTCYLLPAPTVQRPDLLTAVSTTPPDVDCAAALDLTDQDPTINQMMASLALQVVRRMVAGTCPFMGLYLDMEQGTVTPTYANPEAVARVVRTGSEPSPSDAGAHERSQRSNIERRNQMSDKEGNGPPRRIKCGAGSGRTTTAVLRRHKLMTKELADTIPPLYANDGADDPDAAVAKAKLFSPYNGWRWYITEWDAETGLCFGLVEGFETELGYFDLTELAEVTVFGSVPAVERDLYWEPQTLGEIRGQARGMAA